MQIDVTCYEPHTLSLRPFKSLSNSFIDFYSCEVVSSLVKKEKRTHKARPLRIHNGGCIETFDLLRVSSCEMFAFCDVLHEAIQKRKQALESAQYGLEIIFK